jgi:hypothetical protein
MVISFCLFQLKKQNPKKPVIYRSDGKIPGDFNYSHKSKKLSKAAQMLIRTSPCKSVSKKFSSYRKIPRCVRINTLTLVKEFLYEKILVIDLGFNGSSTGGRVC